MSGFNRAEAEQRLGPAAVQAIRELAAAAPPLTNEQRAHIQAVFDTARTPAAAALPAAA
ncbi:hypothetical protein [Streptomyces sp. A1136]|uniref:hypothetical protein n=1 Tax=Streptomyces sp. A1136 TaxID=2563102 RepID=UPI0014456B49|nr:hypothetical protein [Streptomyces sp. A1136]